MRRLDDIPIDPEIARRSWTRSTPPWPASRSIPSTPSSPSWRCCWRRRDPRSHPEFATALDERVRRRLRRRRGRRRRLGVGVGLGVGLGLVGPVGAVGAGAGALGAQAPRSVRWPVGWRRWSVVVGGVIGRLGRLVDDAASSRPRLWRAPAASAHPDGAGAAARWRRLHRAQVARPPPARRRSGRPRPPGLHLARPVPARPARPAGRSSPRPTAARSSSRPARSDHRARPIDAVAQEVFDVDRTRERDRQAARRVTAAGGPDGYAQFQLSVPSANLPPTMTALSGLRYARVASRTDTTQDVNNQFVSDSRQLADARALRTALLKQLAERYHQQQIDSLTARIHDAEATIASDEATLRRPEPPDQLQPDHAHDQRLGAIPVQHGSAAGSRSARPPTTPAAC